MDYYLKVLKNYGTFSGRAQRAEYWYFALISLIISTVFAFLDNVMVGGGEMGILGSLYILFILVPSLAVAVRRLHDTNRSGWWIFINLIPFHL